MNWPRRVVLFGLAQCLHGQTTELQFNDLQSGLDAVYAWRESQQSEERERSATAAIEQLLSEGSPKRFQAAAILLQFDGVEECYPPLGNWLQTRGKAVLPYLKQFRDRPFPTPAGRYRKYFHLTGMLRRSRYDAVIETIQKRPYYGLSLEVEGLVLPLLDALHQVSKDSTSEFPWGHIERVFRTKTATGDFALALLLDFPSDAGYSEMLSDEIVERGKRMLPVLRRRLTDFTVTLARRYPPDFRRADRNEVIEGFLEVIELGETERE